MSVYKSNRITPGWWCRFIEQIPFLFLHMCDKLWSKILRTVEVNADFDRYSA